MGCDPFVVESLSELLMLKAHVICEGKGLKGNLEDSNSFDVPGGAEVALLAETAKSVRFVTTLSTHTSDPSSEKRCRLAI
jgi:hypothetical protein